MLNNPTSLPLVSDVVSLKHKGRSLARYLDFIPSLLRLLHSQSSRSASKFAVDWSKASAAGAAGHSDKERVARELVEPRFLIQDVLARTCLLPTDLVHSLVDAHLGELVGLISVDQYVNEDGRACRSLTLKGVAGVNALLLLLIRETGDTEGRAERFVRCIAPAILKKTSDASVAELVEKIDAAVSGRLALTALNDPNSLTIPASRTSGAASSE